MVLNTLSEFITIITGIVLPLGIRHLSSLATELKEIRQALYEHNGKLLRLEQQASDHDDQDERRFERIQNEIDFLSRKDYHGNKG